MGAHVQVIAVVESDNERMQRARDVAVELCAADDAEMALHVREARHCDVIEYTAATMGRIDPAQTVMEFGMKQWLDGLANFRDPLVGKVRVIIVGNADAMTGSEEDLLHRALDICDGKLVAILAAWPTS